MSLLELYCQVDDFWQTFRPHWQAQLLASGSVQRLREPQLSYSEMMTIIIHFHQSHYRDFKAFYTEHVQKHLRSEFPHLVSYTRFVELLPRVLLPLLAYMQSLRGRCTGISFVDSTPLRVCHNRRIPRHKVFAGLAARGKTSMGWFFGFKLHLVVNEYGEILALQVSPGNLDDRKPVPILSKHLFGKLFADKGYLSQSLFEHLFARGLTLITAVRKNMQNRLVPLTDKLLLRKRAIIETINDQLKNVSQIEHTRHRSFTNFLVNLFAGLLAYCHQAKKPSLHLRPHQLQQSVTMA
ncbi:MAG: IS982 family transposase [Anaerolineae bacterium]|nr:IS982 family transposase [Anaerolineae bacterium]